jgi:hypothetical protein
VANLPRLPAICLALAAGCSARPLPLPVTVAPEDMGLAPDLGIATDLSEPTDFMMRASDLSFLADMSGALDLTSARDLSCIVNGPPRDPPTKLTFRDTDPTCGKVAGTLVVGRAAIECDVKRYLIYYGKSATAKLEPDPFASVLVTGSDVSYAIVSRLLPAGATHFLAYTANDYGENPTPAAVAIDETVWTDISVGQGPESAYSPSATIDSLDHKLDVITDDNSHFHRAALFRCNLDGTGCTYSDISAGDTSYSGLDPRAVIDVVNNKLVDVGLGGTFRCNLDGTGCTHPTVNLGHMIGGNHAPGVAIDYVNQKLLSVFESSDIGSPALLRCNLDGLGCTVSDISGGYVSSSIISPWAVIDTLNHKLLVAVNDVAAVYGPVLFRCNLDGTGCTYANLSAGRGVGISPVALIDSVNQKLLVVTTDEDQGSQLALYRCNLDGSDCLYLDISAGQGANSGIDPSAVIDTARQKLLVAAGKRPSGMASGLELALYSCNLDGTGCTYRDVSAGRPNSGGSASAVLDDIGRRLLVATEDDANQQRLSLFSVCLP